MCKNDIIAEKLALTEKLASLPLSACFEAWNIKQRILDLEASLASA